jgi:hypothetical protein
LGVFREERRDFEEEIDGGEFLVGRQHHQRWLGPLLSSSLRLLARLLALDGRVATGDEAGGCWGPKQDRGKEQAVRGYPTT